MGQGVVRIADLIEVVERRQFEVQLLDKRARLPLPLYCRGVSGVRVPQPFAGILPCAFQVHLQALCQRLVLSVRRLSSALRFQQGVIVSLRRCGQRVDIAEEPLEVAFGDCKALQHLLRLHLCAALPVPLMALLPQLPVFIYRGNNLLRVHLAEDADKRFKRLAVF